MILLGASLFAAAAPAVRIFALGEEEVGGIAFGGFEGGSLGDGAVCATGYARGVDDGLICDLGLGKELVWTQYEPIPGLESVTIVNPLGTWLAGRRQVTWAGTATSNSALVVWDEGAPRRLAEEGAPAPGGTTFTGLRMGALASGGLLTFTDDQGLWLATDAGPVRPAVPPCDSFAPVYPCYDPLTVSGTFVTADSVVLQVTDWIGDEPVFAYVEANAEAGLTTRIAHDHDFPDAPAGSTLWSVDLLAVGEGGHLLVSANYLDGRSGVYLIAPDGFTSQVPTEVDGERTTSPTYFVDRDGRVRAALTTPRRFGLFELAAGSWRPLVETGDPWPGASNDTVWSLQAPVVGADGTAAVRATSARGDDAVLMIRPLLQEVERVATVQERLFPEGPKVGYLGAHLAVGPTGTVAFDFITYDGGDNQLGVALVEGEASELIVNLDTPTEAVVDEDLFVTVAIEHPSGNGTGPLTLTLTTDLDAALADAPLPAACEATLEEVLGIDVIVEVSCDLAPLAPGEEHAFEVPLSFIEAGTATFTATATDGTLSASADEDVVVVGGADLAVDLGPPTPAPDDERPVFDLTVTNTGPAVAHEVVLELRAVHRKEAEDVRLVGASEGFTCAPSREVLRCVRPELGHDATDAVELAFEVDSDHADDLVTLTATVSALEPDPDPSNNVDSADNEAFADESRCKCGHAGGGGAPVGVGGLAWILSRRRRAAASQHRS